MSYPSFAEKFRAECINGSAISPELYEAAIEIIEDTGRWEPNRDLRHHVSTFWQTKPPHSYGAIAFFRQENGELWQGKPENFRTGKDGKTIKYEYPKGEALRAYLPAVDRATRLAICQRYGCEVPSPGESFWAWVGQHPELPIVITEGAKKALALLSEGYVAIALVGVRGGVLVNDVIAGEKVRRINPELIPDLARFAVAGRQFTLAFDQDTNAKTRSDVEAALGTLSFHLEQAGAAVSIASWDGQKGRCKGVDDLIVAEGPRAWDEAYQTAALAPVWRIGRDLARRVRREPDLKLGDAEFAEAFDQIPQSGIVALQGFKGSGKSTLIGEMLGTSGENWLSVTHRQNLAREQAAAWGGVFINDGDRYGDKLLDAHGQVVRGGSVCWPSLLASERLRVKILVVDETTKSFHFALGSKLTNHQGIRPCLITEFIRRVKEAELIIIADADLTEEAIKYIEEIREERAFLVRSDRKPLAWLGNLLEGTQNQAKADFVESATTIHKGKVTVFHSDSRALVEALAELLEGKGIKTMQITQATSGGVMEQAFLQSKGETLPDLVQLGIKVILCSPSVSEGFSIQKETHLIHEVWGIFTGCSISAESIAQSLDRVRSEAPRFIWLPMRGRATSRLSTGTSTQAVLRDIETSSKASLRLVRHSLKPDTQAAADGIDYGRADLKLLASFEARHNRGMRSLRQTVWALLEHEGKRVKVVPCRSSRADAAVLATALQEARHHRDIERAERIANGIPLTQEQADELEKRLRKNPDSVTQAEREALDRFYIAQFYRADDVDTELVLWDKDGQRRREIRNLESILNPDLAVAKTATSIERNPDSPQDWSVESARTWLLAQTSAGDFVRGIWDGSIIELTLESIDALAHQLQSHAKEFEIAFQVKRIDRLTPMEVITWLLRRCGITWSTHRHRVNGSITRRRVIDQENLNRLKAIVERRAQADPPYGKVDITAYGGSPQNPPDFSLIPPSYRDTLQAMWEETTTEEERRAILLDIQGLKEVAA